jgi:hypothetical protein
MEPVCGGPEPGDLAFCFILGGPPVYPKQPVRIVAINWCRAVGFPSAGLWRWKDSPKHGIRSTIRKHARVSFAAVDALKGDKVITNLGLSDRYRS